MTTRPIVAESACVMSRGMGRTAEDLGRAFAEALSVKDFDSAARLLDPAVDFRALTPNMNWQATGPDEVVQTALREWFGEKHELEGMISVETGSFADRETVAYSFRGRNEEGPYVVEQQAYFTTEGGRINWIRILCSGIRPSDPAS